MSQESLCCREPSRLSEGASPFDRAIVLGWYDGPTEGLVRCGACGRVYRFELIQSVDEDRGIRLYSLAPLAADAMDRLVDVLAPFMMPSWPLWAPLWKFPTEDDRLAVNRLADELMASAAAPEFAIATSGLLDEIIDVRPMPLNKAGVVQEWVSWLGSAPSPAKNA